MSGNLQTQQFGSKAPSYLPRPHLVAAIHDAIAQTGRLALIDEQSDPLGMGKSELARAYVDMYASEYQRVIWLRAHNPTVFTAEFAELALQSGQVRSTNFKTTSYVDATKQILRNEPDWLLIADDVRDVDHLMQCVEGIGVGHILITTRARKFPSPFRIFEVPAFGECEVTAYLDDGTGELGRFNGHRAAIPVLQEPVLARIAAVYPDRLDVPLSGIAQLVCSSSGKGSSLLSLLVGNLLNHLQEVDLAAYRLAVMCAHIDTSFILPRLLLNGSVFLPEELSREMRNVGSTQSVFSRLESYGLLRPIKSAFAMPSSVRDAILEYTTETEKRECAKRAVRLAMDAFPHENRYEGYLAPCSRLLGVALATAERCIEMECELDTAGILLNRVGQYLHGVGDDESACWCLEQSARIAVLQKGHDSPILALRLNNLGAAELAAGNPSSGLQHFEQALTIIRTQEESHRALMSEILRNLVNAHLACEDLDSARIWLKEALARHRHYFGHNHPYVVECLNQLGLVFAKSGMPIQSLKSFHHAVDIGRQVSGLDPALLASCLSNLGEALRKSGDLDRAESLFGEALALRRAAGDTSSDSVAKLLVQTGRIKRRKRLFGEAAALFEEALAIGLDWNSDTSPAAFSRQIGRTYVLDGNLSAALKWYKDACKRFEAQGEMREPDFMKLLIEIGEVSLRNNDEVQAVSTFRQAQTIREDGVACPDDYMARLYAGLGEIEERRSNLEEAIQCYGKARALFQNVRGADHPDVARQMVHMGRCLHRLGRGFEAVANIVYAERVLSKRLGSNHRDTRRARELLEQMRG